MAVDVDVLVKKGPGPLDGNSMKNNGANVFVPFTSIAEAHNSVNVAYICEGDERIINISGHGTRVYWYKGGKAISNLVPKVVDPYLSTANSAAYFRVSDTLIGIVDQFTGEPLTFKKTTKWWNGVTMDDTKVDGIYYIKVGTEYFVDSDYIQSGLIRPERFGAIANGITNCTDALTSSMALGGKISLNPNGTYFVNNSIYSTLPINFIKGNGANIRVDSTYTGSLLVDTLGFDGIFKFFGCAKVEIEDLTIDFVNYLGEVTWQPKKVCGVLAVGCDKVSLDNVEALKCPGTGIYIEGDHSNKCTYVKIQNPTIEKFYRMGIYVAYSEYVEINDPFITGTGSEIAGSVNTTGTSSFPGTMQEAGTGMGCLIIHSGTVKTVGGEIKHCLDTGIKCETSESIYFNAVKVRDFGKDGIKVQGRGDNPQLNNVIIVHCQSHDKVRRRPDGSACILVHDTDGAIVTNNIVFDNFGDPLAAAPGTCEGIRLTNLTLGGASKNVIIADNVVKRLALGDCGIVVVGEDTNPILERDLIIHDNWCYNPMRITFVMGNVIAHHNSIFNDIATVTGTDVQAQALQIDKCFKVDAHKNKIRSIKIGLYVYSRDIAGASVILNDNEIESAEGGITCITGVNNTNEMSLNVYKNNIRCTTTAAHDFRGITTTPYTVMDVSENTIDRYHTGIFITVGIQGSVVKTNNNKIYRCWSRCININASPTFTPDPVIAELLEMKGNFFRNWNRNDTRPAGVAAMQNNVAMYIDNNELVTFNVVKIEDNAGAVRGQFTTDVNGVNTAVLTTQQMFETSTKVLKYPKLYFKNNTIDVGTMYSQSALRTNFTAVYGASWSLNCAPGTLVAGATYNRDVLVPVSLTDSQAMYIVRHSELIPEGVIVTGRIYTDGIVRVTYRNVGTVDAVIPAGNALVLLVTR